MYNCTMKKRLTPKKWLSLNKQYLDKWYRAEVWNGKKWLRLEKPHVGWNDTLEERGCDTMEDEDKNLWWIQQELEIMEKSGKVRNPSV